ncbi:nephrin-like [Penaeus japonicus]|uniref:nephrin-like n=1 Tax=Penaeus japonicus TaxID=27405 RepID=UPI001C70E002|nr:nephrin-like [Penaeus japonicus]
MSHCIEHSVEGDVQRFLVTPKSVQVKAGDDVFFRCVVRNQQGNAQWTKDGFALGFSRTVPGYPRYRYAGDSAKGEHHLIIKGVTLQDDGEYQCQVGPTANASAIWAAANLTVMVAPRSISLGERQDGAVEEVKEGEKLMLECYVRDARPAPSVAWYRGGLKLDSSLHKEEVRASSQRRRWSVRSRLSLQPGPEDDTQQYSCRALHPALEDSPTTLVASVVLSVLHAPSPPTIRGYKTGEAPVVGDERTLTCEVEGGNPRPRVAWYRHGRPLNTAHKPAKRRASGPELRRERVVRVTQDVTATRLEDGAVYECRVTTTILPDPISATVTFTVHYAPSPPTIRGYKTGEVLVVGDERTLTCEVVGGNPRPRVAWYRHGRPLNTAHKPAKRRASGPELRRERVVRVTQDVTATRLEDGAVYECRVTTTILPDPISATVTFTVHYSPTHVNLSGPEVVRPGQHFSLTCTTSPANPPAVIAWMIQGIQTTAVPYVTMEAEEGGWVTTSELTPHHLRLHKVTEISVSCRAYNPATDRVVSQNRVISVTKRPGRPVLKIEPIESSSQDAAEGVEVGVPGRWVAGEALRFSCSSEGGNPLPVITMYLGKKELDITLSRENSVSSAWAEEIVMPSDNKKQVTCKITSPGLSTPLAAHATLDLLFPPLDITGWPTPSSAEPGQDMTLTCETSSSLPPSSITWYSKGHKQEGAIVSHTPGAFGGTVSRSELVVQIEEDDRGRTFTCEATNGLGVTVATNVTVNLLHGPVWLRAPSGRLDVKEGDDVTITAVASANPPSVR